MRKLVQSIDRFMAELRADHSEYSQILLLLSREVDHLNVAPRPILPLLREALQFVTQYLDAHHHPREDVLYERLARRSKRNARLLASLRDEHKYAALMSRRISKEIDALGHASTTGRLTRLGDHVNRFVDISREHIGTEERVMYSQATEALSEQDWRAIMSAAPEHASRSSMRHNAGRSYPLLAQYFHSSGPHLLPGDSAGLLERIGLHAAGAAYGHLVGRSLEAAILARRQNVEAVRLALTSIRTMCTPRPPTAYAKAVKAAYQRDAATIARWIREWKEQVQYGSPQRV